MSHDVVAIAIPTLTIVLAALLSRADVGKTRTELNESFEAFRAEIRGGVANVTNELTRMNTQLATHTEQFAAIRERLARLEERLRISA